MNETRHGDFRDEIEVTVPTLENEKAAERHKQADAMWAEKTKDLPPYIIARSGLPGFWEPTDVCYSLQEGGSHVSTEKKITFSFEWSGFYVAGDPERAPWRLEGIEEVGRHMERFIQGFLQGCSQTRVADEPLSRPNGKAGCLSDA